MSLKIASWNVEGRLSVANGSPRRGTAQIIESIRALDADVLVLLEAHSEVSLDTLPAATELADMGYELRSIPYGEDFAERPDAYAPRLSLLLLSRLAIRECEAIPLGTDRTGIVATVECASDRVLRIIGVHLDDREEATRVAQMQDLVKAVCRSPLPTVVMGDFNAMHGDDVWPSKFLQTRVVRALAHIVLPDVSRRAVEMARGDALHLLESATGLTDADERHQPTTTPKMRGREWMPSIRLMQIDHIFTSTQVAIEEFAVAGDGGADHRAISAYVSIQE
jgi:endonuclease/exonuclease/phosphatase family metal-dependent hydrolase